MEGKRNRERVIDCERRNLERDRDNMTDTEEHKRQTNRHTDRKSSTVVSV